MSDIDTSAPVDTGTDLRQLAAEMDEDARFAS